MEHIIKRSGLYDSFKKRLASGLNLKQFTCCIQKLQCISLRFNVLGFLCVQSTLRIHGDSHCLVLCLQAKWLKGKLASDRKPDMIFFILVRNKWLNAKMFWGSEYTISISCWYSSMFHLTIFNQHETFWHLWRDTALFSLSDQRQMFHLDFV